MYIKLKTWLRRAWWRLRGRQGLPVIVERVYGGGTAESAARMGAQQGHTNTDQRFGNINPTDAAEEIFAPSHGEEDSYKFTGASADGAIPGKGALWNRVNNAVRVRRRKVMMVTCSQSVVRSPEEITCICSECHGPDINHTRCIICGAILCQIHARVLEHPTGPAVYCRQHLEEAMDNWDTWAAYDANRGELSQGKVFNGRPFAIAKYTFNGNGKERT